MHVPQRLAKTGLCYCGREKQQQKIISSSVMLDIKSINTSPAFFCGFPSPKHTHIYNLKWLGRKVMYLDKSLLTLLHCFLPRIQQQQSLRNTNRFGSAFHTLVLYFFMKLLRIGARILTPVLSEHFTPPVWLQSSHSGGILHGIRHSLAKFKLLSLRQRKQLSLFLWGGKQHIKCF